MKELLENSFSKKNIAVTGGSGHLGTCLIKMLLSQEYIITALYTNTIPIEKHKNLTWIKGDITDIEVINSLIKNCNIIIHSAGIISIGNKNNDEVYRVNVEGTKTIIDACAQFSNIKLIYISSSNAVKEGFKNEVFDENRPYKTSTDFMYPYTKALAEQQVLKAISNLNLDAFIIRPTSIVGPPDFKPSLLGETILDLIHSKLPVITTGGYNLVDVRDISQTIINSFEKGRKGETYLIGGQFMTIKEIAKAANPTKIPLVIHLNILLLLLPFISVYKKIFHLKWPISKESLITLKFAPENMDFSKAIKELNHKSRPINESIEDLKSWFQKQNL